jgi:hypothetical protein
MCGTHLTDELPQTTCTYAVSYDHSHQRWHAHVCSHTTTAEGGTVFHGTLHRDFGPFDDAVTVAQWLSREVFSQTKLQALRDNLKGD